MGEIMKEHDGIIVNKYGAIDLPTMTKLIDKVTKLGDDIILLQRRIAYQQTAIMYLWARLYGWSGLSDSNIRILYDFLHGVTSQGEFRKAISEEVTQIEKIEQTLIKRIDKIEELTKANDYEFVTETKLVKKEKKE